MTTAQWRDAEIAKCDASVRPRRRLECRVVTATIRALLAAGFSLSIDNGGDDLEFPPTTDYAVVRDGSMATDVEHLIAFRDGRRYGWVMFVYGNDGYDAISDYTTNLEAALTRVHALTTRMETQGH